MKRILFIVNGYGLGNSTRIHSIIENLDQKYKIDILGYGNSKEYFKKIPNIENLFENSPLEYGLKKGEINTFRTLKKLFQNLKSLYKNRKKIKEILKIHNYSLIVSDSDFSAIFLRKRPQLISINNADKILQSASDIKKRNYFASFLIEYLDFIYHQLIPDKVISPFFKPLKQKPKIQNVGLMIRKDFLETPIYKPPQKHSVLITLSGNSSINKDLSIKHEESLYDLFLIGNSINISGNIKRYNKTFNISQLIKKSTLVVTNGGLSSLSEALALKKPVLVIPVKKHLEQRVNANWIQKNNFGLISSWENLDFSIKKIINNYSFFKKALIKYENINGARQATHFILKEIEK
ncbi:MAG: hypothetical protein GDA46_05500 [Bdellovibrionales bacterium]|nr:hypothetical protein [Bdellovibrionales bacterium]